MTPPEPFLHPFAYDPFQQSAIEAIGPGLGARGCVLPLLNGMAHLDVLDRRFGRERVRPAAVGEGADDGLATESEIRQAEQRERDGQRHDDGGHHPRGRLEPPPAGEAAHPPAVAGEVNQRYHGEGQLHAEDHLAEDQELTDATLPGETGDNDRGMEQVDDMGKGKREVLGGLVQ